MTTAAETLGKLNGFCKSEKAGRDDLLNCCNELLLEYKFETVFIAAGPSPEETPKTLVWLGIEEMVDKSLWRVGVEDRIALTQTSFKSIPDVTGPVMFNPHGSLKIQKTGSGVYFALYHPGRGYLILGCAHRETRQYPSKLTDELAAVWKDWKDNLWEVAARVLRQLQIDAKAVEEAQMRATEEASRVAGGMTLSGNSKLPKRFVTVVDEPTRLFNRHYFEESLSVEAERAKRYNRNLTLILLSVAPLGKVDEKGENLLVQQAAETLVASLRKVDILCRIEKYKFALLLPDTPNENGVIIARRVFKHFKGLMGDKPTAFLNLASASYPRHASDAPALLAKAEEQMDQAKAAGPNKAVLSE